MNDRRVGALRDADGSGPSTRGLIDVAKHLGVLIKFEYMKIKLLLTGFLFLCLTSIVRADPIVPPAAPGQTSPDLMPTPPIVPPASPDQGYDSPHHTPWWKSDKVYPEDESRLRLYASTYYNFAGSATSTNGSVYTTNYNGPSSISVDMALTPGFSAEAFMARPYGWGFDFGVDYDLTRTITILSDNSATIYYSGTRPTLQMTTVYGNGIFRLGTVYLPIGINYLIPTFTGGVGNGAITNSNFVGNVGFQFGVGILLGRNFAVEFEDRIMHFQCTSLAHDTTINWGDTYLSGLQINLKFSFL